MCAMALGEECSNKDVSQLHTISDLNNIILLGNSLVAVMPEAFMVLWNAKQRPHDRPRSIPFYLAWPVSFIEEVLQSLCKV